MRDRIQDERADHRAVISLAAVLISVLSLFLILRENRRQRQLADMSRRSAEQAEFASRAKSRFLSMMSHELRNPLNGVLGPLALLDQSELAGRHKRLVEQAQQSGQSMLQMLTGLLDYGEMQDGRFQLRTRRRFRLAALADRIRDALVRAEGRRWPVGGRRRVPEFVMHGDLDRLRQVIVHLTLYRPRGAATRNRCGSASPTTGR